MDFTSLGENEGLLRLNEWVILMQKPVEKSIWKMIIFYPGGPLTMDFTSLGENEGLLRFYEW